MMLEEDAMLFYRATSWDRSIKDIVEGMVEDSNAQMLLEL